MKMNGKFTPMVSFQKSLRVQSKPDHKLVARNWLACVCGWGGGRISILKSTEISSTIGNDAGCPLGDGMFSFTLRGNYCMDI